MYPIRISRLISHVIPIPFLDLPLRHGPGEIPMEDSWDRSAQPNPSPSQNCHQRRRSAAPLRWVLRWVKWVGDSARIHAIHSPSWEGIHRL